MDLFHKTREAVFSAFTKLLKDEPYSKSTVQEIIDTADIGRTTFYAHFETKDDLLSSLCTESIHRKKSVPSSLKRSLPSEAIL